MLQKILTIALLLAFPLLTHAAVLAQLPWLQMMALAALATIPFVGPVLRASWRGLIGWVSILGLLYMLTRRGDGAYFLYLPSFLIPGLLLWFFGRTLLPGQEALITRFARSEDDTTLTPEVLRYTRNLTWVWVWMFVLMWVESAALLALGETGIWSICTNFLNYLAIAGLFLLEYPYRRWRFPYRCKRGFVHHLMSIGRYGARAERPQQGATV